MTRTCILLLKFVILMNLVLGLRNLQSNGVEELRNFVNESNTFIETCSHKIRRQIEDLEKVFGILSSSLTVDGVPVNSYLTKFVRDDAKYPTMSALKEIVDGIHVQVAKIDHDLKKPLLSWEKLFHRICWTYHGEAKLE